MTSLIADELTTVLGTPLDAAEELAAANDWMFERDGDELTAAVGGHYCEYQLRFFWHPHEQVLQVACVFEGRVASLRRQAVYEALGLMNERQWLGHFELFPEEGLVMFRYGALADAASGGPGAEQIASIAEAALSACERFYPVFQYVVWGGKTPHEAIEAAMLETVGEA